MDNSRLARPFLIIPGISRLLLLEYLGTYDVLKFPDDMGCNRRRPGRWPNISASLQMIFIYVMCYGFLLNGSHFHSNCPNLGYPVALLIARAANKMLKNALLLRPLSLCGLTSW